VEGGARAELMASMRMSTTLRASVRKTVTMDSPNEDGTSTRASCSPKFLDAESTGKKRSSLMWTSSKPKRTTFKVVKQIRQLERKTWTGATKLVANLGDTVIAVAISADDLIFAAGGVNKVLNVYSTANGTLATSFRLPAIINAIAFSEVGDDTKLYVGTFGGLLHCKHVNSGRELGSIKFVNGEGVLCLAVSDNPRRLAAGGSTPIVVIYDLSISNRGKEDEACEFVELVRLKTAGNVLSLTLDGAGQLLVTGGEAKNIQVWDVETAIFCAKADSEKPAVPGESVPVVATPELQYSTSTAVQSLSMTPDGKLLAVGTAECTEVYLIIKTPLHPQNHPEVHLAQVGADSLENGNGASRGIRHRLSSSWQENKVVDPRQFEYELEPAAWFDCSANQGGVSLATRDGHHDTMLAIAGHNLLSTYSLATGAPLRQMPRGGRMRCVALSRDGSIVVAGGFDKKVTLNLVEEGAHFSHYSAELEATVRSVHLTPDSSRLAVGGEKGGKGFVELFNTNTDKRLANFEQAKPTWCVRLSPDGQLLAAAGYDMALTLYDAVTLTNLMQIKYPPPMPAFIWSMSFSRNGCYLAVGCWNKTVYLYEINRSRSRWRSARAWLDTELKLTLQVMANHPEAYVRPESVNVEMKPRLSSAETPLSKLWASMDASLRDGDGGSFKKLGVVVTEFTTVGELRKSLASLTDMSAVSFSLAYGATFLNDDKAKLGSLGIPNESTIVLSRSAPANSSPPEPTARRASQPNTAASAEQREAKPMLTEVAAVTRTDRVYAVALCGVGRHMAVGGRDKCVVLYDMQADNRIAPSSEPVVVWEKSTDDFIYSVALTDDLKYVAYGGTSKLVHLCDGLSGRELFRVNAGNTIWSTALLENPPRLVYGGETPAIVVMDLNSLGDELQLPVHEIIQAISITSDAICFANGKQATMYGKAGIQYGWQDQPAHGVVSQMMLSMLSTEEILLKYISLVLAKHPSVVNSQDALTGKSLLQFAVEKCPMPRVIDVFLKANVKLGMGGDVQNKTALYTSVLQGKWRALQQIIDALLSGRFGFSPNSMRLVMQAFQTMASKHPREFLYLVTNMPLEPEPEILSTATSNAHDIMLPRRLVSGSDARCPRGLWETKIDHHRVVRTQDDDDDMFKKSRPSVLGLALGRCLSAGSSFRDSEADSSSYGDSGRFTHMLSSRISNSSALARNQGASLVGRLRSSLASASKRGSSSQAEKMQSKPGSLSIANRKTNFRTKRRRSSRLGQILAAPGRALGEVRAIFEAWESNKAAAFAAKGIEEGYCKAAREGGISAMRIPFQNIAGFVENSRGVKVAPLQLIVDAVAATHEYAVFGAQSVDITLEYKWKGFALKGFLKSLLFFCLHLLAATTFNFYASRTIDLTVDEILGNTGETPYWGLLLGWVWTTVICLYLEYNELYQLRMRRFSYFKDYVNVLDQTFMLGQLTLNLMFWIRDSDDVISVTGSHIYLSPSPPPAPAGELAPPNVTFEDGFVGREEIGLFLTLQALVVLSLFLRLVGYSRGILALGALVHMVAEVFLDIIPFMMLLTVTTVGFSFSLSILLQHTPYGASPTDYGDVLLSLYAFFNMGVYAAFGTEGEDAMRSYWQVLVVYEIFMIAVQLVLLNLLIGIMTDTHGRVREVSQLVAHFERAKLVLEEESKLVRIHQLKADFKRRMKARKGNPYFRLLERATRYVNKWFSEPPSMDLVAPKWLHVLLPVDLERKRIQEEAIWRDQITAQVTDLGEKLHLGQQKLLNMVGDVDRQRRDRETANQKHTLSALNAEVERLRTIGSDSSNIIERPQHEGNTPYTSTEIESVRSEVQNMSERMKRIETLLEKLVPSDASPSLLGNSQQDSFTGSFLTV